MYLRNGRIVTFDLSTGESEEQEVTDESAWDNLSSIKIAEKLAVGSGGNSIILGTGVLTGSFVPAACAGLVLANGRLIPILGFAGLELKLSGFDFVVLKGKASEQGYIWFRDGIIEFVPAQAFRSMDSWQRTDKIRSDQGDGEIQVLCNGPWGDGGNEAAQLIVDHWGGEDKFGMGAELGRRNLVAIAFRGMGELELAEPDRHLEDAFLMMREHIGRLGANDGFASYTQLAKRDDFARLVHRHVACYGCPYPCRSFLKVYEEPKELRLMAKEPGYLHYDIPGLSKAFESGLDAKDATVALIKCAKAGAEPASVISKAASLGGKVSLEKIDSVLSRPAEVKLAKMLNFEASFGVAGQYEACLGLGLCPRYWSKVGFDKTEIASFSESTLGTQFSL